MKIISNNKTANILLLVSFSLIVIVMLSSFINRVIISPPVQAEIDNGANTSQNDVVIQVNVLNACGETGLAAKVMEFLRLRGFDVVEIGNYPKKEEKSFVLDRLGDVRSARKVAYAIGVPDSLVVSAIDSTLFVRSTVVIGKDFPLLKPFN
ncbi:MAG: LytR C-terminal domain-containing protein [Ignavibacteria bacterium]|nr:LytR C-terminal domain-containing protein [Ignavibacteria bacterium]